MEKSESQAAIVKLMAQLPPDRIIAELWRRGDLEGLFFHEGQHKIDQVFKNAPGAVVVLNISRQWGKTFFAVVKALVLAIRKPGAKIRIGAAFETNLTEFIEPAFELLLASCPAHLRPKYNQQKKRYVFPNGSSIKCVGLDRKPNGLRGNSIDLIIVDEAGFASRLAYLHTSVFVPLTTHKPDAKILILSTPPESPDHEFWDFVERAKLDNSYAEFTIDENPLLTPKDIARIEREMGGRHTTAFQREYLCKRVVEAERALIPEFEESIHVKAVRRPDYFSYLHTYEFLDTGVRHFTVELLGYYDFPRAVLVIEDEIVLKGSQVTTRNIKLETLKKEKELGYIPYRRVADNNNLILLNDLAAEGVPFGATDKDSLEAMVNALRLWTKDNRIEIHPRCKFFIGSMRSGLWNKNRDDFQVSTVYGHCDAIAAAMYGVRNVDVHTNPVPANIQNPWLARKNATALSPEAQNLKNSLTKKG